MVSRQFIVEGEEEFSLEEGLAAIKRWESDYNRTMNPRPEYAITRRLPGSNTEDKEVTLVVLDVNLTARPVRSDREEPMF